MKKFQWDERMIGFSLAFVGLLTGIVQGGLTRILIPKLGTNKAVYLGISAYAIGFVLFAFATKGWMMFAFMIPLSLGGLAMPALQGMISNQVPANEQGEMQGALTSLVSITSIIGPLLMTNLFAWFTGPNSAIQFPGAPFLMAAILTVISLVLVIQTLRKH
jgi:DHA1 family tetracycline resistance protein-like MFS transporter